MLDLVADQSEEGVELVPGSVTFTFDANWKLQLENCSDAYHFTSAHPSYIRILEKRQEAPDAATVRSVWEKNRNWSEDAEGVQGGSYSFANGHVLNWGLMGVSDALPLYERADALAARVGEAARDWMFNMRNLTIFPNLQIAENASSQLRVIRPIAAGRTEMRTWCIAPVGESAEARRQRIRQYEDFFNPSGMATPDDTVSYENCQRGHASRVEPWLQGYARGMTAVESRRQCFFGGDRHGSRAQRPCRRPALRRDALPRLLPRMGAPHAPGGRGDEPQPAGSGGIPLPRGAAARPRRLGRMARALFAGRNLLDARLARRDPIRPPIPTASFRSSIIAAGAISRTASGAPDRACRSPRLPAPRTVHAVTNVLVADADEEEAEVSACFSVHLHDPRSERSHVFFGRYEYRLRKLARTTGGSRARRSCF